MTITHMGSMVCKPELMMSQISNGYPTAWDGGLDVATGPKFGTLAKHAEDDIKINDARKRGYKQEDIAMNEISDINFDYHEIAKNRSNGG